VSKFDWNNVLPTDEITARGKVVSVEKDPEGRLIFTVENAELLDHKPRPKGQSYTIGTGSFKIFWYVGTAA